MVFIFIFQLLIVTIVLITCAYWSPHYKSRMESWDNLLFVFTYFTLIDYRGGYRRWKYEKRLIIRKWNRKLRRDSEHWRWFRRKWRKRCTPTSEVKSRPTWVIKQRLKSLNTFKKRLKTHLFNRVFKNNWFYYWQFVNLVWVILCDNLCVYNTLLLRYFVLPSSIKKKWL